MRNLVALVCLCLALAGCSKPKLLTKGPRPTDPDTVQPTTITIIEVVGDTDGAVVASLSGQSDEDAAASSFAFTLVPGVDGVPADPGPTGSTATWTGTLDLIGTNGAGSSEALEIVINP